MSCRRRSGEEPDEGMRMRERRGITDLLKIPKLRENKCEEATRQMNGHIGLEDEWTYV